MTKEGAPHATMVEAFVNRLQQLYPQSKATYSLGRKVTPPGLKPDVYVEHEDGRRWAFEMVHHNRHAQHLLENHRRYAEAGISDHWVLWHDLQPQTQGTPSPDQGVMTALIEEERRFTLTAPQQAILEMQESDMRYLYAFTINPLKDIRSPETMFSQTVSTGVIIYRFEGWDGEEKAVASQIFVPMYYLEFNDDGTLQEPIPDLYDAAFNDLADLFGLDEPGVIPSQVVEALDNLPSILLENPKRLVAAMWTNYWVTLSAQEKQELEDYFQSIRAKDLQPIEGMPTLEESFRALSSPADMHKMIDYTDRAQEHLSRLDMPAPLKRFIAQYVNSVLFRHVLEVMEWQEDSEVLRQARGG